jgi:hypothetical protein
MRRCDADPVVRCHAMSNPAHDQVHAEPWQRAATHPLDLAGYLALRRRICAEGFTDEVAWSEGLTEVADPLCFWREYAWVVLNSGIRNQVARSIWNRVRPAVEAGGSAADVFRHAGKAAGIDRVWKDRQPLLDGYIASTEKLAFLQSLPWIGTITCWHLAKNYGLDVAKPDRHLVRIAGSEGTHALCARLARASGDRIATVDGVIWRAANLGWV